MSNFAGFVIPTYLSLIALRTPSPEDDTQLLTYWIIFGFLSVIEFWSAAIIYVIPFYWFLKTIFLIYISLPATGGAKLIYTSFVGPLTDKYIFGRAGMRGTAATAKKHDIRSAVDEASESKGKKATGFAKH